ncbi:MAG: hypothetical protein JRC92_06465 [Deltaproteobacteria bacterium]|nr:hypothetical protein [Deltaproteobacteria bacterium]
MKRLLFCILAVVLVLGLGGVSLAEVSIRGNVTLETSWGVYDDDWAGGDGYVGLHALTDNDGSTLCVEWTSDDDRFGAVLEIGLSDLAGGDAVETSLAFFTYTWDSGSILFGQDDSISDAVGPSQTLDAAAAIEGFGNSTLATNGKVSLSLGEEYKFIFALEDPYRGDVWGGTGQVFHTIPGLSAAAEISAGSVLIHPWVHYEHTQWENGTDSDAYNSLDMGLEIEGDFGLYGFAVGVNYGLNTAQNGVVVSADPVLDAAGKVDGDVSQLGYWGELRIGGAALGCGRAQADRTDWAETAYTQAVYANYAIEFGQATFVPEIVWFDNGEDGSGADMGSAFLFGLVASLEF